MYVSITKRQKHVIRPITGLKKLGAPILFVQMKHSLHDQLQEDVVSRIISQMLSDQGMGKYLLWRRVYAAMTTFANITMKVLQIGPALTSENGMNSFSLLFVGGGGEGVSFFWFSMFHVKLFLASLSSSTCKLNQSPSQTQSTWNLMPAIRTLSMTHHEYFHFREIDVLYTLSHEILTMIL